MKKIEPIIDPVENSESVAVFSKRNIDIAKWQTVTNNSYSHNTLLSFRNDWKTFVEFCKAENLLPLPANAITLRRFIEKQSQTRKLASIKRYMATISLLHKIHNMPNPTKHREVRFTLNKLFTEKSDDAEQANGFHIQHLQKLDEKFSQSEKLKDIRDLLIWTLCFEAMLKRNELAALPYDAITKSDNVHQLKVNETTIELSEEAGILTERWLRESKINDGYLLRRINKHNQLGENPMDHSSIYRVFRRASTELGLNENLTFSGQSPRVGASKDLSDAGKTIPEIQQQGRWKSPAMPAQYVGNKQARDEAMNKFKRKVEKD